MNGEIAVAISAAAALLGTWLGSSLTSRHEDRRWLRQERLNAYTAFMGAADAWRESATAMWVTDVGSPERLARGTDFYAKFAVVDLAADRARLIGSDTIQHVLDVTVAYLVNDIMTLTVQDPKPPQAQWQAAALTGYVQHIGAFQQAARDDLMTNP